MESDLVKFFELVERLQAVSPELIELALRYGPGNGGTRNPFFEHSPKVNLERCQVFLDDLRQREDSLRQKQAEVGRDLLQIQAARRDFEEALKEKLRAEHRCAAFSSQERSRSRAKRRSSLA